MNHAPAGGFVSGHRRCCPRCGASDLSHTQTHVVGPFALLTFSRCTKSLDQTPGETFLKNIDSGLSTNRFASIQIKVIRRDGVPTLAAAGRRDNPIGGRHGARRIGECVFTLGFDQGPGTVDCQARVSPPSHGRAAAAPRSSGSHHCLHADDLHRSGGAGSRSSPPGRVRCHASHRGAGRSPGRIHRSSGP